MPVVKIPRLSWKAPVSEDPAYWRSVDLSEEAIVEFQRAYGADKVRGLNPAVTAAAKAAASAKRAAAAKAAAEDAERQAKTDAEAAKKAEASQ